MNFSSPDEINVVTENKQSTEVIMFDKKLLCKKYTIKKENLFKKMYKHTEKMKIGTNSFQVAELELALLESLYSPNIVAHKYTHEIIKKAIRKYKKIFNTETIESILKTGKHHTSVNRLHTIIQSIDKKLASEIEQTIKKYSFFIDT